MNRQVLSALTLLLTCSTLYCPFMPNAKRLKEEVQSASGSNENPLLQRSLYEQETTTELEKILALKKHDPNEVEIKTEMSPLAYALRAPTPAQLILLIKAGVDVKKPFFRLFLTSTPLMGDIEANKSTHQEALLKAGLNPYYTKQHTEPLLNAVCFTNWMWNVKLQIIALLLRSRVNPFIHHVYGKSLLVQLAIDFRVHHDSNDAEVVAAWKRVGRALVQYKILWNHLHRNWCLPQDIAEHILTFVDFELDDYHRYAMERSDKKLQNT